MYCTYFGFTERPFNLTPNPAFIYLSRAHQEAFAHLIYGIENRSGFIMLTGEVGAGKTTVIRTLLAELKPESHATALILNPMVSADGLLRAILREFGIDAADCNEAADMVEALNRFLLQQTAVDRKVVLVIDEAQDMEPSLLEQVRLLSNLETTTDKLIQIILVGQPELETLMNRPELRQLNQRITVRFHLTPMELPDTGDYIRHRIKTAANGNAAAASFAPGAVRKIQRFAGGLPRLINAAADRALLIAFNQDTKEIDATIAGKAIADVSRSCKDSSNSMKRVFKTVGAVLCLLMFVSGSYYLIKSNQAQPKTVAPASSPAQLAALSAVAESDNRQAVMTALAAAWGKPSLPLKPAESIEEAVQNSGFSMQSYNGNLGGILRIGYPALLQCLVPPTNAKRYILLLGASQQGVTIATGANATVSISSTQLEQLWTGKALIPWRNSLSIPVPLRHDAPPRQRQLLIQLMSSANAWPAGSIDYSDAALRAAIRTFQMKHGIENTGIAGSQTVMQLYRFSRDAQIPTLQKTDTNR